MPWARLSYLPGRQEQTPRGHPILTTRQLVAHVVSFHHQMPQQRLSEKDMEVQGRQVTLPKAT